MTLDQVVLAPDLKKQIVSSVENMEEFRKAKIKYGMQNVTDYGNGMVILFHGISVGLISIFSNP